MKLCCKKTIKIAMIFAVMVTGLNVNAQERDPFAPTGGTTKTVQKVEESNTENTSSSSVSEVSPLTSYKLNSYKVVGVMVSENKKVAAVKALNGVDYIVKTGDAVGNSGGKISSIDISGIKVKNADSEIEIPVSNKIEVNVDKGKDK